jgi:hypothetical protein
MGMFDRLFINTDKLPVTDEEKKIIEEFANWQTKDFDCKLSEVYITDEGELKINRWEYESVPKEERPYPNDDGFRGLIGCIRRTNERLEKISYNGCVNFYSFINGEFYEFWAKFINGELESIEGGRQDN